MGNNRNIKGICPPEFQPIRDAFQKNFLENMEDGASFALFKDGKCLVDLWGGHKNAAHTDPWEKDTITNVFSTTKIMTALCANMLIDRDLVDPDAPVVTYWPEFAQNGKEGVLVKHILSHTSGLSGFHDPMSIEKLCDWKYSTGVLARQKPWWEPGTKLGYHAVTFGHLVGEVVRRVSGKSLGQFFKEEVADKIGADFHIGFGPEHDHRVADMIWEINVPGKFVRDIFSIIWPIYIKSMANPIPTEDDVNSRLWRQAEIPSSNGHGNARSAALIGSILACGGRLNGHTFLSKKTVEKAIEVQVDKKDKTLRFKQSYGLGFGISNPDVKMHEGMFHWGGYGGSFVIMDLNRKLSYAYVMNRLKSPKKDHKIKKRLSEAVEQCLSN